ncbi:MAG: NADH-quinone oxidoreductase subunit L [Hyphomonadaceae bacterium]
MLPDSFLTFIVLAPGLAALIAGLGRHLIGDRGAMVVTTATVGLAGILSFIQLFGFTFGGAEGAHHTHVIKLMHWMHVGDFTVDWAIRVDALSMTMMAVVTGVSGLVHLYSWGYMKDDPDKARFFSYLSLFTFAMLMLVVADNFIQLFFGWEGVGLASYLLIGFWYTKDAPNDAAIKAFVTNRVGDFGLVLGVMAIFLVFRTVEIEPVLSAIRENAIVTPAAFATAGPVQELTMEFFGQRVYALELIGVLLFIGAMGKSAQFFLHVWLPDAMEGPTPVSALIHAATMVTAGVYLVCLVSPIYEHAPYAAAFVTIIGAVTAIFAATVGLAQNDIKRVIAYSTCSQLGYMFFAAGVGAYQVAMFHLFTHAFFKALLFLGAGAVINGVHHEQDMRKMGGLLKFMPFTYAIMMIGTIAIIGLGVPGTDFGFSGFFSKDAIIESAYAAGAHGANFGMLAFWAGIGAALLTSFYSFRLIFMTFHGKFEGAHHGDDHGEGHHGDPHDPPMSMKIPLILLAIGAIGAGYLFYGPMVHHPDHFWGEAIYNRPDNHVMEQAHHVPLWVKWAPLVVTITGFVIAVLTYLVFRGFGKKIADRGGLLHGFLFNKWYFDELYQVTFVRATKGLGDLFWKTGDKKIIDGFGPDGVANLSKWAWRRVSAMQTGYIYHYAFMIIGGALVFGAVLYYRAGGAG